MLSGPPIAAHHPVGPVAIRLRLSISLAVMLPWPVLGWLSAARDVNHNAEWLRLVICFIGPSIYAWFYGGLRLLSAIAHLLPPISMSTAEAFVIGNGLLLWATVWLLPAFVAPSILRGRRRVRIIYACQSAYALLCSAAGWFWLTYPPVFIIPHSR